MRNIIKHNIRTSMNKRTLFFIKICLSHFILQRVMLLCMKDELETGTDCYIDPKFFFDHKITAFSSWLELLNRGSLRTAKPSVCKLVLTLLASCLQLTQTVCALVIFLSNVHLLPLFFKAHFLIDGSVEGQYITQYCSK